MHEHIVFGLVGAGGFGREVAPVAAQYLASLNLSHSESANIEFFVVDKEGPQVGNANGLTVLTDEQFLALDCKQKYFNVAISDSRQREHVATTFITAGATPLNIVANSASNRTNQPIGDGAIICDFSVLLPDAKIGRFFHSNIYSYVAHDCVIGDYVTFAPRVSCNGNIRIDDHAYVGTGAIIRPGDPTKPLHIGEGAIIGMGAVVTKDVAPYTTVVGNPARPICK